jgi:hypothetical protein
LMIADSFFFGGILRFLGSLGCGVPRLDAPVVAGSSLEDG